MKLPKRELDALPYPHYAIPGNMDTCNKHTDKNGATGREDIRLNVTAEQLDRFVPFFGDFPWSFVHKNVRFSGFYAAVAGSGLPHEDRACGTGWRVSCQLFSRAVHHVVTMHYTLFMDALDEPKWDITKADEYRGLVFFLLIHHTDSGFLRRLRNPMCPLF